MPLLTTLASDALSGYGFTRGAGGAGPAMELIATQVLLSNASSVTFSSIPATYTHLQIRWTSKFSTSYTSSTLSLKMNGDSGSNYNYHRIMNYNGSVGAEYSAQGTSGIVGTLVGASGPASGFAAGIIEITDYANTTKLKVARTFGGAADAYRFGYGSFAWLSAAAINSINIYENSGASLVTGSRFSLYGIKGA